MVLDSEADDINGEIVGEKGRVLGSTKAASHEPIQAGKKVYICILKCLHNGGSFPVETILHYDIIIAEQRLVDFGLT